MSECGNPKYVGFDDRSKLQIKSSWNCSSLILHTNPFLASNACSHNASIKFDHNLVPF